MSVRQLKVKIKTLAVEAALIRREERKVMRSADWLGARDRREKANMMGVEREVALEEYSDLHNHRVVDVRQESRAAQLAYAFLRGRPLLNVDTVQRTRPNWSRVVNIVTNFGEASWLFYKPVFEDWVRTAELPGEMQPRLT